MKAEMLELDIKCLRCDIDLSVKEWSTTQHRKSCMLELREQKTVPAFAQKIFQKGMDMAKKVAEVYAQQEVVKAGKLVATRNTDAAVRAAGVKTREPKQTTHTFNLLSWNVRTMETAVR
jgi:hypothetical protein